LDGYDAETHPVPVAAGPVLPAEELRRLGVGSGIVDLEAEPEVMMGEFLRQVEPDLILPFLLDNRVFELGPEAVVLGPLRHLPVFAGERREEDAENPVGVALRMLSLPLIPAGVEEELDAVLFPRLPARGVAGGDGVVDGDLQLESVALPDKAELRFELIRRRGENHGLRRFDDGGKVNLGGPAQIFPFGKNEDVGFGVVVPDFYRDGQHGLLPGSELDRDGLDRVESVALNSGMAVHRIAGIVFDGAYGIGLRRRDEPDDGGDRNPDLAVDGDFLQRLEKRRRRSARHGQIIGVSGQLIRGLVELIAEEVCHLKALKRR